MRCYEIYALAFPVCGGATAGGALNVKFEVAGLKSVLAKFKGRGIRFGECAKGIVSLHDKQMRGQ